MRNQDVEGVRKDRVVSVQTDKPWKKAEKNKMICEPGARVRPSNF